MHQTRIFRNGNSQAVRIPAELAYPATDADFEIERDGDELRIRPVRRSLGDALRRLPRASPKFMAEGRGEQDQADREPL
jgi:antitoxin VapB